MAEFESVLQKNHQKLYTLAFRMTGNREDAEDALQLSFINAFKGIEKFAGRSSITTWLYRIVINTSKRYSRERRRLPAVEYSEEHGITQQEFYDHINSYGSVEDDVIAGLTREACLQMFMNCMPSKYRVVYTLRNMLKFSTRETAEILEMSETSVKVNLHRARKIAQSHFKDRCSLIYPGSMCDCRSYAGYIKANKKENWLGNIELIKNKEKAAAEKYSSEMKEILEIDSLYNNQVKPPNHSEFIERVKQLIKDEQFIVLGA